MIPPPCHNTPAACVTDPFSLFVNGAAGPAPALQNCWAKATFVWPGGCSVTWRHPAGLCGVWGRAQVHCACTRPGSKCHVTSIVPRSERTTLARSQCGRKTLRLIRRNAGRTNDVCFYQNYSQKKNTWKETSALSNTSSNIRMHRKGTKTFTGDSSTSHCFKNYFQTFWNKVNYVQKWITLHESTVNKLEFCKQAVSYSLTTSN